MTSSLAQKSSIATLSIERSYFLRDEEVVGSNPATPTERNTSSGPVSLLRKLALIMFAPAPGSERGAESASAGTYQDRVRQIHDT